MQRVVRNLRISARALGAHPVRTALCIAGTAVGIAGVLVLSAIGAGAQLLVLEQIDAMGHDVVVVNPPPLGGTARLVRNDRALTRALRLGDAEELLAASPAVRRVAPVADRDLLARVDRAMVPVNVIGTTPAWQGIRRHELSEGRFFTAEEDGTMARVAVLGAQARALLFPEGRPALGQMVRVGGIPLEVVGVLRAKGLSATGSATEDDKVIVPLATARRRIFGSDRLKLIFVQMGPEADESDIAAVLNARRDLHRSTGGVFRIDGQRVVALARLAAQRPMQRMLVALSVLSLTVAGVGVAATMLLSVRERRHEIGLRLAVGARRRDLSVQFLAEATVLSGAGGALGIMLGALVVQGIGAWTPWDPSLAPSVWIAAGGGTVLLGILSGVAPARRAATMDPVAALAADTTR